MDRDGTNDGYDIELTRAVAEAVPVPVIASGGAGELGHLSEAIADGGADAVLCASIFHYGRLPGARGEGAGSPPTASRSASSSSPGENRGRQEPMNGGRESARDLVEALRRSYPELEAVRAAATQPVYLVGGAVRDLLLGRGRADLDLVVEGDAAALAARLGGGAHVAHERFATAKVDLDGHELDIAGARTETYPRARRPSGRASGRPDRGRPRPPRLHDQRDGDAAERRAAADRSLRRSRRPERGSAARPASALLPRRPDAGDSRRPLRGPLRLRAGAGDGAPAARGRPRHGLRRPPRGGAVALGAGSDGRHAASSCWPHGA